MLHRTETNLIITANDTAPPPNVTLPDGPLHPNLVWPTPGGITEDEAREICEAPIKLSAIFAMCENFTAESLEVIIDNCMLDIQVSDQNGMNFVNAYCSLNLNACDISWLMRITYVKFFTDWMHFQFLANDANES